MTVNSQPKLAARYGALDIAPCSFHVVTGLLKWDDAKGRPGKFQI